MIIHREDSNCSRIMCWLHYIQDLAHIRTKYGDSPAVFRHEGKLLYYVYDSYHIKPGEWATILSNNSNNSNDGVVDGAGARHHTTTTDSMSMSMSVRGTEDDGIFLGLWLEGDDGDNILSGSFDGSYTYFASASFSFGSTPANWARMAAWSRCGIYVIVEVVVVVVDDDDNNNNRHFVVLYLWLCWICIHISMCLQYFTSVEIRFLI